MLSASLYKYYFKPKKMKISNVFNDFVCRLETEIENIKIAMDEAEPCIFKLIEGADHTEVRDYLYLFSYLVMKFQSGN